MSGRKISDETKEAIRDLRARGMTWLDISNRFGVSYTTARCICDPVYAANEAERRRRWTIRHEQKMELQRAQAAGKPKEYLPPVPRDTRDLTARIMGDPLPGRSALDRMRNGER